MLSLLPNTTHKLQPLHRDFFKLLKAAFNAACQSRMRTNFGRRITDENLGEYFSTAYLKAATVENAINVRNDQSLTSSDFLYDPKNTDNSPQQCLSETSEPEIPNSFHKAFLYCQCIVCSEWWHNSKPRKSWVKCSKCQEWLHELCSGKMINRH